MLASPHTNSWGFVYTNAANGSVGPGTFITPGTSDAEGSFVEIAPDASITSDIYYMTLFAFLGATSGQSKQQFLDVAYDPTGGTTYDKVLFENLALGGSPGYTANPGSGAGRFFHLPCKVPAGSAIAARVQGSNATAGNFRLHTYCYGKPSRPELWRPAAYSETLGVSSGTLGTSFTPGNATFGSWASLGTTTKKHFWAQLGVQIDNNTMSAHGTRIQLGIGAGGASDTHVIIDHQVISNSSEECWGAPQTSCTWEIPAGAELWVRGNNSAAPVTGYNATAVLFGG